MSTSPKVLWTIPNAICIARILATPLLIVLAVNEQRLWLVGVFFAMTASDWLDGKLAILLDQRSEFGARLDSLADVFMYTALLIGTLIMDWDRLLPEAPWLILALVTYLVAGLVGKVKFSRWPSYHTSFAKISWFLILIGAVLFLVAPTGLFGLGADQNGGLWARWPLRLALLAVTLGNLQSLAISSILPTWQSDVRTIKAARQIREQNG